MRVIAGSARSLKLKTVESLNTRPTTDKIKETIFNILNPYLYDCIFLDLFSGSGAIGIEALSRGAGYSAFVDNNRDCIRIINDNLRTTHLEDKAEVIMSDSAMAIKRFEGMGKVFDIIFMDPPYNNQFEEQVLNILERSTIINSNTIIVVEASKETDFSFIDEDSPYEVFRVKEYKTNKHVFIKRND